MTALRLMRPAEGPMTRRTVAWIALAVIGAIIVAGIVWEAVGPTTIVLTAPQLQERINRALPREFKGITVEKASVNIAQSQIALKVEARASALGQTLATVVSARGVPRYEPEQAEIFFDPEDVKVEDLAFAGGPLAERLAGPLRERAQTIRDAAAAGMRAFLAARPVYRFKDDVKGIIGKAALGNIAMQPDAIVITLSAVKLSATVAIGLAALLAIVFLIVLLVRHPRWGQRGAQ
jgi:hypothetical protein